MNKYQILRSLVLSIRAVQDNAAEFYPVHIPCTEKEAREALRNVARLQPGREVEISVNDGWVWQPCQQEGWEDEEELVFVPQYCGIEIRSAATAHGPLHVNSREFGIQGLDPWFRKVHEDWTWAVTPF